MRTNSTSRTFPALAAVLLAIILLAAGAAAWLRWGAARPASAEPPVAPTSATTGASPVTPQSGATADLAALPTKMATPAGTVGVVPTVSVPTATVPTATVPTATVPTTTPHMSEYTVVEGDTLGAIAARFGVSAEELAALNGLADPDQIAVGAVLRLPGGDAKATSTDATVDAPPAAAATTTTPAATAATPVSSAAQPALGQSYGGRPIEHYVFGAGPVHLVFVGAIHGGYEWNSANLAYAMIDYFERNPAAVPDAITLHIVPVANPDGLVRVAPDWQTGPIPAPAGVITDTYSGRFNGRDVDLNRNWDCNWRPTAIWRDEVVAAGSEPFSEPEVVALRDLFLNQPMQAVVLWHSAAGMVLPGACQPATVHAPSRALAEAYGQASDYTVGVALNYEISGDASDWLTTQGIPSIAVELTNHSAIEWDRNLAGTLAVLNHYAAVCAAEGCGESDR